MRLWTLVAALILCGSVARAQTSEERDFRARQLYEIGRKAYGDADYQKAYDSFKESFSLSHKPALLYNVASALQQLKRPHDAAETLRSYLRLRPDDSERPQIEERIRALEEEQRLLDIDRERQRELEKSQEEKQPPPAPAPTQSPIVMPTPAPALTTTNEDAERRRHKRNVTIAVTVGSIVVVGLAVGLGLGLGLHGTSQPLTTSNVGPLPGTR